MLLNITLWCDRTEVPVPEGPIESYSPNRSCISISSSWTSDKHMVNIIIIIIIDKKLTSWIEVSKELINAHLMKKFREGLFPWLNKFKCEHCGWDASDSLLCLQHISAQLDQYHWFQYKVRSESTKIVQISSCRNDLHIKASVFCEVAFNHWVLDSKLFDRVLPARIISSAKNSSRNLKLVKIENAVAKTLKPVR